MKKCPTCGTDTDTDPDPHWQPYQIVFADGIWHAAYTTMTAHGDLAYVMTNLTGFTSREACQTECDRRNAL
jgi:hypothetical protein